MHIKTETLARWNHLQEPSRFSQHGASYLRLLSALDSGWQIVGMVKWYSSQKQNDQDQYCFTLAHPSGRETQRLWVPHSHAIVQFINDEQLPVMNDYQICGM